MSQISGRAVPLGGYAVVPEEASPEVDSLRDDFAAALGEFTRAATGTSETRTEG